MLLSSFQYSSLDTMVALYKICVRLLFQYCSSVWSPQALNEVDQIESIQRFFTRSLPVS